MEQLRKLLSKIDARGYKAYKELKGRYQFNQFQLTIDHVQGDPFAAPTRISVTMPMTEAGFPLTLWQQTGKQSIRKIALQDYLARIIKRQIKIHVKGRRGSGGSGEINIECGQQQVLPRNAVMVATDFVEARLVMGLPANGRRVAAGQAREMFFNEIPRVISQALIFDNLNTNEMNLHIDSVEDQDSLRNWLESQNLVAFIGNEANLPRSSGIDDRPLHKDSIAFKAPASLACEVNLPNSGVMSGLGIPKGITLIVGGGFHGKSTVLHALERGVYNHIPGDGRERVVSIASAVKIRAEDGRAISKVNISPFIDHLPFDRDTQTFSTENASGSTSQAANIIEAIECGTKLLLIDEDTSATNFMIRDERMQQLVVSEKEPITPLVYRVRDLYENFDISSIIVMGGSGDYFDVADSVIMLDAYTPLNVTDKARKLSRGDHNSQLVANANNTNFNRTSSRKPGPMVLDASRKNRDVKIDCKGKNTLLYGEHRIDLSSVEQLIDIGQTRAIGLLIHYYAHHYADVSANLIEGLEQAFIDVNLSDLDVLSQYKVGNLALPRLYEVAAAINRIRDGQWL